MSDEIKVGDIVEVLIKLGNIQTNDYPKKGTICKVVDAEYVSDEFPYNSWKKCYMFEGYPKSHFLKEYLNIQNNNWFRKVEPMPNEIDITKLKEPEMLDPIRFAVGTKHKTVGGAEVEVLKYGVDYKYYTNDKAIVLGYPDDYMYNTYFVDAFTGKTTKSYESEWDLDISKPKHKGWINIYPANCTVALCSTKQKADKNAAKNRIACIEIEYEEGQGL